MRTEEQVRGANKKRRELQAVMLAEQMLEPLVPGGDNVGKFVTLSVHCTRPLTALLKLHTTPPTV